MKSWGFREKEIIVGNIISHKSFVLLFAFKCFYPFNGGYLIFDLLILLWIHFRHNSDPSFFRQLLNFRRLNPTILIKGVLLIEEEVSNELVYVGLGTLDDFDVHYVFQFERVGDGGVTGKGLLRWLCCGLGCESVLDYSVWECAVFLHELGICE